MARVYDVRLELVRPGPPHNQLLSPLTPYMALCGEGSPVTFHIEFEHRQLLNRLERLRYVAPDGRGNLGWIPDHLREAQVQELGEEVGRILARITTLSTELARARSGEAAGSPFIHLRLVLSGSELAILPFELARAPQAFPGEGLDLFLQGSLPIVVTREVRRSRPLSAVWGGRDPKVLLVCAAPEGLSVPIGDHLRALRDALDPWIDWPDEQLDTLAEDARAARRLPFVKKQLRVISDASIEDIYRICATESFTHVHILAHGDVYREAGEERFGVALHRLGTRAKQVVGGKQLAQALRAEDSNGVSRSEPLVVTLAMCDSGQQGSVLVPGGSIAHDLHTQGIPWVFASQFPLTKAGSIRIAAFLYPRLIRGDDPRQVLYELRRHLSMTADGEHDWASIVTYASPEPDLEYQAAQFFERQTVRSIEVQMARADRLAATLAARADGTLAEPQSADERHDETHGRQQAADLIEETLRKARECLDTWELRLPPQGHTVRDRIARTNCFGMQGSTFKRMGLLYSLMQRRDDAGEELRAALEAYRRGMAEWVTDGARFNWTASQYLALAAVLRADTGAETGKNTYAVCRRLAERDLESLDRSLRAWAHGTLAELDLIRPAYDKAAPDMTAAVVAHCRSIVDLMGVTSFHAQSTRRQLQRYVDRWYLGDKWPYEQWSKVAGLAVEALNPGGSEAST